MQTWKSASTGDLRRFKAIQQFLVPHPKLTEFLFRPDKAELRDSPENLRARTGGYSSGERALIRIALDIWSESGNARLNDLSILDATSFKNVILGLLIAHGFNPKG